MGRYSENEPDLDRYEDKPIDAQDEPQENEPWQAVVDPAEYAAHNLISAIGDLELQLAYVTDIATAIRLKNMIRRAFEAVDRLDLKASDTIDTLMERAR